MLSVVMLSVVAPGGEVARHVCCRYDERW